MKLVKRLGVRMDEKLFNALLPFVALGGLLRGLEEFARLTGEGVLPHSPFFLTPGIYMVIAILSFASLLAAVYLRREDFPKMMLSIGWVMVIGASLLAISDVFIVASGGIPDMSLRPGLFLWILLIGSGLTLLGRFILDKKEKASRENTLILGGFAFEAAAVATAVYSLSYTAEQPLTQALLSISPPLYPVLKMGLVLGIIHFIEGVPREEEAHWLSKLILLVLGVPMGIHNSLQIFLGL